MSSTTTAREKEILQYWREQNIFEKSVQKDAPKGEYVFYDGPPFATGLPHYGHLVASIMKDVVPRYQTMRGFRVERRWGWDCHGLPIENIVEKELGFKQKKDIIAYGIDKFNETCRSKVLSYAREWEKTIERLGRWADMQNAYQTMDRDYMESIWWVFKELWDKKLIYQDYRSLHICPRCETTLSQQEVSEGYQDVTDISAIVKFELVDEPGTFILAWTTTPWTLPGNVALAVSTDSVYVQVTDAADGKKYILQKETCERVLAHRPGDYAVVQEFKGSALVDRKYQPLFPYFNKSKLPRRKNAFTVYAADFVTTEEGTGVVHIAPGFGEDDLNLGREKKLPLITHVTVDGHFTPEVKDFAGLPVKPIDDPKSTDKKIVDFLQARDSLFATSEFSHSYPHCWRCETPLLNYATESWFVKVTKIKTKAIKLAQKIGWTPEHIKEGRFGKWLEGARDWSISRQRFWASVMPIWQCDQACGEQIVFGSAAELEAASGQTVADLHKHVVDLVTFACKKCGGIMRRVPDVLDTWFDSGSMPYAQMHYPFENQERFEKNFPAEFIAEGVDQTRAWFYYLHVLATALKKKPAFKNVIVNGIVLAEDGKKMSKKLNNYPDPNVVLETYGADALRYYLLSSPVMEAESINFSETGVKEAQQQTVNLLENVLSFYLLFAKDLPAGQPKSKHPLDRWIVARLHQLIAQATEAMEDYDLVHAVRPIQGFIGDLSRWYVRRSRDRFKAGDKAAVRTLGYVLAELAKVIAPFMPFIAESIYQQLQLGEPASTAKRGESVHLDAWPKAGKRLINPELLAQMEQARTIVERGLAARALAGIKIRQPLQRFCSEAVEKLPPELVEIVCDELNVKEVVQGPEALDTTITDALKLEGLSREVIRQLNQLRKETGLTIDDKVVLYQTGLDELFTQFGKEIKQATGATKVTPGEAEKMVEVGGGKVGIVRNERK